METKALLNISKIIKVYVRRTEKIESLYRPESIKKIFGVVYDRVEEGWYRYGHLEYSISRVETSNYLFIGVGNQLFYRPNLEYYYRDGSQVEYFDSEAEMEEKLSDLKDLLGSTVIETK